MLTKTFAGRFLSYMPWIGNITSENKGFKANSFWFNHYAAVMQSLRQVYLSVILVWRFPCRKSILILSNFFAVLANLFKLNLPATNNLDEKSHQWSLNHVL